VAEKIITGVANLHHQGLIVEALVALDQAEVVLHQQRQHLVRALVGEEVAAEVEI